eukprot:TRINITY_DN7618_c0_g1_i1.p1 TRINITY_DN7618_c0_g1~~TRINITY_DN7618_c0_g1_i1.p1  ORF type:complete len:205 (+),score=26.29 TRINITY_DN7618_c0_g1_i1:45-659(+)
MSQTFTSSESFLKLRKPQKPNTFKEQRMTLVNIGTVRKHLKVKFEDRGLKEDIPFGYDFERLVDDFVFLCVLGGNDFLPHLPYLDIRYGAVDYLLTVYYRAVRKFSDYLVKDGRVQMDPFKVYLKAFSRIERELITGWKSEKHLNRKGVWKRGLKRVANTLRGIKQELDTPSAKRQKGLDGKAISTGEDIADDTSSEEEEKEDL